MYSNYLILFVTLYWLWIVASAVLLQRSDFETFIRRSRIHSRSKPPLPNRIPISFILETIPFLIRRRAPLIESNSRALLKYTNATRRRRRRRRSEKKGERIFSFRSKHPSNESIRREKEKTEDRRWRIHKIWRARNPRKGRKQRVQTCTNRRRIADASRMHRKRPIWRAFREPRGSNPRSQGLRDRQRLEGGAWKKRGRVGDSRQILGALSPAWRGTRCSKSSVEGSLGLFTRPQLLEL